MRHSCQERNRLAHPQFFFLPTLLVWVDALCHLDEPLFEASYCSYLFYGDEAIVKGKGR